MFDSKDEIICMGTSAWILLDSKSLRPKLFPQLFPDVKMYDKKDALADLPQKILHTSETELNYTTQIRYSDIDLNQHANNAKYIELMLDCFSKEFHKEHTIKSLVVSFNAESKYGDEIHLFNGIEKNNPLTNYIEARNEISKKVVFQANVVWN